MNLAAKACIRPRISTAARPVVTRIRVHRHAASALAAALIGIATVFTVTTAGAQSRLDTVRQRGTLLCGSHQGLAGFGIPDAQGNWTGFDVDLCRAVAAAIFDDPRKVRFVPLSAKDRFTALQSGDVDVLSRNTTWTMSRDTQLGLDFAAVTYYDGQAFMVRNKFGIASAKELNGASICVAQGTTNELNVADYFRAAGWKYQVVTFATNEETIKVYESGRCDSITSDASTLASQRLVLANPTEHAVLPDIISKEPLGPVVRHGDNQWADIIRWTHMAMVNAEELGISRDNVDDMKRSTNPEIKRLLGTEGKFGEAIGLSNDWACRIIKHIGNYGESFERNLGGGSPLRTPRGLNALWSRGGLQYGIPVR
jgi:general L-amino acid transport system substrate-binding protein